MAYKSVCVESKSTGRIDDLDTHLELSLKPSSLPKSLKTPDGTCKRLINKSLDVDDDLEDATNTIHIDIPLRHCYCNENEVVEFQCRVSDTPKNKDCEKPPTCYWYKNGELIRENSRIWLTVKNQWHRLKIQSVTWSDYGVYTFVYKNTTNCVMSQAMLFVLDIPSPGRTLYTHSPRSGLRVVKHLSNLNTKVGERIVLTAKFETEYHIDIKFTWIKNYQPIAASPKNEFSNSACGFSQLSLDNGETSDSGIYTVIAKTIDSYASSMCEVLVMEEKLSNFANKLQKGFIEPLPEEVETFNSEEVRLTCQISDVEYSDIYWFKDNIALDESGNIAFQQYGTGGRTIGLTLKSPQIKDMGEYTVVIKNKINERVWKSSCFLYVTHLPTLQEIPEVMMKTHLTRTFATIGSSVFLYCKFKIPNCKYFFVVWYIGLYKIERSNQQFKVVSHDGSNLLYIKQVEPDMLGEIRCQLRYVPPNQNSVPVACTRGTLHHLHPTILQEIISDQNRCVIEVEKIYSYIEKSSSFTTWSVAKPRYIKDGSYETDMNRALFHSGVDNNATVELASRAVAAYANQCDTMRCRSITSEANILNDTRTIRAGEFVAGETATAKQEMDEATQRPAQLATKETQTATDKEKTWRITDSKPFVPGVFMDIVYCKMDEIGSIHYLTIERVNHEGTVISVHIIEKHRSKNPLQVVIQWDHDYPTADKLWYSIEMPLLNGDFAEIGMSSQPQFEITDPIPERIMKFRVRIIKAVNEVMDMVTVSVMPSPKAKNMLISEYVPISSMDYFLQKYSKLEGVLGCGAFGSVSLVRDSKGDLYAAKIIKTRTQKKRDQALREYKIMLRLKHPRLVQLYDAFCSRDQFIIVMDYLWGGELFERIVEEENFKEATAVTYVRQICEGLDYLHKQNIAHLDLKPENVVCLSPNSRDIKIVDFGLSRVLNGEVVRAIYGTRDYIAPEALSFEPLTTFCDMWSLGVVTYVMLSGVIPFAGETWATRSANITKACYNYDEPALLTLSSRAREFIDRLLVKSPGARMSASAALHHRWLVYGPPADLELGQIKRWRSNMRTYLATNKARWQRAGNVVIAANRLRARGLPSSPRAQI